MEKMQTTSSEVILFKGHTHPLSNMYPCELYIGRYRLHSSEQLYMMFKASYFGDRPAVNRIFATKNGYEAKKEGQKINGYDDGRWKVIRNNFMYLAVKLKFDRNPDLKEYLLNTGNKVIAEATWDRYWGTGIDIKHKDAYKTELWPGENQLGKLLMGLRNMYNYWI